MAAVHTLTLRDQQRQNSQECAMRANATAFSSSKSNPTAPNKFSHREHSNVVFDIQHIHARTDPTTDVFGHKSRRRAISIDVMSPGR